MSHRSIPRAVGGLLALVMALAGAVATASAASAAPAAPAAPAAAVRVIYYDASRAGEFVNTVHQAAAIWNERVPNIRLQAGSPASIVAYVDNGWPRAYPGALGSGRFYMGRQATNQGHYALRVATHEIGHLLGLPDRRTGLCSDLMSGSSAPASCRNAYPSSREAAEVQRLFGGVYTAGVASRTA
ncbi:MAG TPA: snapalysin family zinc-dependent metalloprotease [Pilimelia sp.]|nr:snapalysin family zinc-dependent metalloprotease [Pilimelia sp.]